MKTKSSIIRTKAKINSQGEWNWGRKQAGRRIF